MNEIAPMSISERLDEIQARADAANDGPWEADGQDFWTPSGRSDFHLSPADVKFIVAARADVPALVSALRAVLDLHKPVSTGVEVNGTPEPDYCPTCAEYWPCGTYRALGEES